MKITAVQRQSPLFGRVSVGSDLVRINGHLIADEIDFRFHSTDEPLTLELIDGGQAKRVRLESVSCGDLGVEFEKTRIKVCRNKCLFCFVDQQPRGLRRSLYIKDDDYLYSFTHGNFISLSRLSDGDFDRIVGQRLSPLYISVHATDDRLRRRLFGNEKLEPIKPRLEYLVRHDIVLHTQAVICPGINDGVQLEKTIDDLAALAPGVASLAVVPVGLTRYRHRLPALRLCTRSEAQQVVDLVAGRQKRFQRSLKSRFVYAADEFFLLAGRDLPLLSYYEEMPQFENGVGMARKFIVDFNRRKRFLPPRLKNKIILQMITGRSAELFMRLNILPPLQNVINLKPILTVADNKFWGKTVTVTGLLTGQDLLRSARRIKADVTMIPPNCLNGDDLFLDDLPLDEVTRKLNRTVVVGSYNLFESVGRAIDSVESL